MEILKANNGQKIQYIVSTYFYVRVWDYGKKQILFHLKVPHVNKPSGTDVWAWMNVGETNKVEGNITDLQDLGYVSFDDAINKSINNPYCTVYSLENFEELRQYWDEVRYVDTIQTTYTSSKDSVND